jgi:hypothetical protein
MALPPYQISSKSTKRLKSYYRGTHKQIDTQTGDLISHFYFLKVGYTWFLMMETGLVPETLVSYDRLKRLIVGEDLVVLIAVKA